MRAKWLVSELGRMVREQPWAVLATLVGLHLVVSLLAYDPVPHTGGDNAAYLSLARSLLDHGRYLELWDPARPPHTQYPPGFPVILAVAWGVGLRSWAALKLMMVGFSAVAVGASYLWMRERASVGAVTAAGLGLLLAMAPGLAGENKWVLSDIPFWAVTMGALLAFERRRLRWGIALAFAALTLRTAGLPLVLAAAAWLALRRRWKHAAITLGVLVGVWLLWSLRSAAGDGYASLFWMENPYDPAAGRVGILDLVVRMVENGEQYAFTILMRTLAGGVGIVGAVAGGLMLAAAAVGFGRRVLPRPDRVGVVEIFAVLYTGMLLLWPQQWATDRFLIPLLPVLLVYAALGLEVIPRGRARRAIQVGAMLAVLALGVSPLLGLWTMAGECRRVTREVGPHACLPPAEAAFLELADWSRGRLPADAVVMSRKPRLWYWYSGYPGAVYPFTRDREALLEAVRELGAEYVVLDVLGGSSATYLVPAVAEYRRRYCAINRVQRGRMSATLLGVLAEEWDPERYGIPGAADAEPLEVPVCPPGYTVGPGG